MRIYIFAIPLIVAAISLIYIILREMTRGWFEHRVKMLLLERLENNPELLYSFHDLQELLDGRPHPDKSNGKLDLTITGSSLAIIGILFVVINTLIGKSQWGVGAYFGGVACVVLGFLLTVLGLVIRILRRPPK